MRKLLLLTLASLLAGTASNAESLVTGGYQEAVFSVSDADSYAEFFTETAGWKILHEGPAPFGILQGWQLPDSASAREIVLGNPGTERGFVRLMEFKGVEQQQIRSSAQTWDTGGWFDVNSRVLDMDDMFGKFQARDWQAVSDPVQFAFGPFVVKEWLVRGPDGIVFALIERVQPPLEGYPRLRKMSRLFNATQIVTDIEAARRFYIDQLGFKLYLEHSGASDAPGSNVLGLPHNLAAEIPRHVVVMHPDAVSEGSIEILQFDGLEGADFSDRAAPPNLGILMLRFPVRDIEAFAELADVEGFDVVMPPTRLRIRPYGDVTIMGIRGPDGALLEFYETQQSIARLENNNGVIQ